MKDMDINVLHVGQLGTKEVEDGGKENKINYVHKYGIKNKINEKNIIIINSFNIHVFM